MLRSILLAAIALAVAVPSANAALADKWLPVYDAADGVTVTGKGEERFVRFAPKAAALYRSLAGRQYTSGCAGADGTSGMDVGRVPRKRGRVEIAGTDKPDLCFISARLRGSDPSCILTTTLGVGPGERPWCARVIVALNAAGRAHLDALARAAELIAVFYANRQTLAEQQKAYGPDVVALATPDELPPAGKVGFFDDGRVRVAAALLADGTRRFVRRDGDVFSTNVEQLTRDPEVLTLY